MAHVSYELEASIATITIDDGKANALTEALIGEVCDALDRAEADGAVVVLAGRPGRFSGGFDLPTLTAFLHRYFEIMKDETRHVIQVEERRVSEAMREQFREDMWEYHPELLEAELLAVRQEPVASFVAVPAP